MSADKYIDPMIPFESVEGMWRASVENCRELERLTGRKVKPSVLIEPMIFEPRGEEAGGVLKEPQGCAAKAMPAVLPTSVTSSSPAVPAGQQENTVSVDLSQAFASVRKTLAQPPEIAVISDGYFTPKPLTAAMMHSMINGKAAVVQNGATSYDLMKKTVDAQHIVVDRQQEVYCFNGRYYSRMPKADVDSLILDVCREDIKENGAYNLVTGARHFLMAESQVRKIDWAENDFDAFLTFCNGNLDIRTGQFVVHTPNIFTTYALECSYLGASCAVPTPVFDEMLMRITGGDAGMTERLWQILGYCLVPDTSAKKGFLFQGVGDSGKTILAKFISSFFPAERVTGLGIHDLEGQYAASELENVSLCISGDLPAEALKSRTVGMMKALSGSDIISGNRKYKSYSKFYFKGKFLMMSNHALLTKTRDEAFEKRIVAVPFCYAVPEEEQNHNLIAELAFERDAVASKAIDAYFRLRQSHYCFAGAYQMNSASVLYRSAGGDLVGRIRKFLMDNYEQGGVAPVFSEDAYYLFCRQFGEVPYTTFSRVFKSQAEQLFQTIDGRKRRGGEGYPRSCLMGLQLRAM